MSFALSPFFRVPRASWFLLGLVGLLVTSLSMTARAEPNEAQARELVESTAEAVIAEIRENQAAVEADPEALLEIVDRLLLPHVDSERMTRLVLGRYYRQASPSQRAQFNQEFQRLLVRTYAGPLSELGNQKIEIVGTKPGGADDELVVESEVSGGDLGTVPVDYRMAPVSGEWKSYDVVVDGISLVNNYRGSFAQKIQRDGIDGLIRTLREQNEDGRG
ncbi:ABC transporter substrate-binding protein [Guyparkeria sp. SCN-R1]|uniref:MlaC/ttg2D family ABC transporter substrate-binding protein n=1 Tax=Guyparkeria sp. SCN-R1 TaxID=2341113 RepID=UPI000F652C12|nr:ABC transporter substrate-binding protein [Guyparkeria sp. SCN-R1]RRQ23686.1 ABC transporter substrate-binding protein [Guyparkeria sp. SCN-R1]